MYFILTDHYERVFGGKKKRTLKGLIHFVLDRDSSGRVILDETKSTILVLKKAQIDELKQTRHFLVVVVFVAVFFVRTSKLYDIQSCLKQLFCKQDC
jgi:hypothetical protein